jgi:hypothetical protein
MPQNGPRRPCRDYERAWRNHCVDRNLEDSWLEALNALEAFDLISICEGHISERSRLRPHINLRLKSALVPVAAEAWDSLSANLAGSLSSIFDAESTSVTVEIKLGICLERGGITARRDLTTRIEARRSRSTPSLDAETSDWFRRTVRSIEKFDRDMVDRFHPGSCGTP